MTHAITRHVVIQHAANRPTMGRPSRRRLVGHPAWQTLCALSIGIKRAVLLFVDFWNIPSLGTVDAPEVQSIRTTYHV